MTRLAIPLGILALGLGCNLEDALKAVVTAAVVTSPSPYTDCDTPELAAVDDVVVGDLIAADITGTFGTEVTDLTWDGESGLSATVEMVLDGTDAGTFTEPSSCTSVVGIPVSVGLDLSNDALPDVYTALGTVVTNSDSWLMYADIELAPEDLGVELDLELADNETLDRVVVTLKWAPTWAGGGVLAYVTDDADNERLEIVGYFASPGVIDPS